MKGMTVGEVIRLIESRVPVALGQGTVDTLKCGDDQAPVRGIATTFMATRDILARAVDLGANFIITHEPTFYNHLDDVSLWENDPVCLAKLDYLRQHDLAVWRFHDGWHRIRPDGILLGEEKRLGWENRKVPGEERLYDLADCSLEELAKFLKQRLGLPTLRVAGPLDMRCRRVALWPGAAGGKKQMETLSQPGVQVVICGESPEWETCEYVRDAAAAGRDKALIVLGHANSEEGGMAYFAEWLRELLKESIPVTHLVAGDPFRTL